MPHSAVKLAMVLALAGPALAQTPTAPQPPLTLTLQQALDRARQYGPAYLAANLSAQIAHEESAQAKAALLPTASWLNQFIYTQPNGTPSGVFVSNDGPHVYNEQATVHGDIYAPGKRADYHRALAAEAVARAKAEVAARGLAAVVVQDYYAMTVAQRKLANARQALREAQQLLDITQKLEQGGEAAHADAIKAEIQVEQRQRDLEDAQLALDKARVAIAILLFPDFRQDFALADDLGAAVPLPDFPQVRELAAKNNPDIRAAEATVQQQTYAIASARAAMLPALSFDYFFGINANQFALYNRDHLNNLGSVAQAQLTVPLWTWGAARSKVREARLGLEQARNDLTFTQRQLLAELQAFYGEARVSSGQVGSLRHSMELSADSLRLTTERYTAGEATVLEVVDAQTTLWQARNAYDDGLARYRLALANLQTLTGTF
jgi:outer membrane protein TolC